jgi:hypothetical protein
MKPLGSHMTTKRTNRRQEQEFRMALKRGSFAGPGRKTREKCKGVLGRGPMCKGERSSRRQAVEDEGAEVAEGSWNIRVESSECPKMAYFVPL